MITEEEITLLGCENGETRGPAAFEESYRIMQDPWELAECLNFVTRHFHHLMPYKRLGYLEIGIGRGGLFRLVNEKLDLLIGAYWDDNQVEDFAQDRQQNIAAILPEFKNGQRLELHNKSTRTADFERWVEHYSHMINFVFVDGDHSYDGVSKDVAALVKVMKAGTLIALHDTIYYGLDSGVARIVREIEDGKIPRLRSRKKFEKAYGIFICEVVG